MGMKRKFDIDSEDIAPVRQKQLKLFPFPNFVADEDVSMSDAESLYPAQFHLRLPSNASSASSSASDSPLTYSPPYPSFELYPFPPCTTESEMVDAQPLSLPPNPTAQFPSSPSTVGLIQPTSTTFVHHGSNCTQIPKLRIACASGINGQRSMWSHCEQCGAISMVDCD
ncbi:hypothetical protein MD484_g6950, partial [Candolleomyces efflorescens]